MNGTEAEAPILRAHTYKTVVFENNVDYGHSLQITDKAGALIDRLIGICFACPEYLRPIHARRHIVLLNELKQFIFESYRWNAKPSKIAVAEILISELNQALEQWIFSFFNEHRCAMMPCYALDTARFLQFHIEGFDAYDQEHWRIKPMLSILKSNRDLIRFIDARFKREFTQRMSTLRLVATVPTGCSITDAYGKELLATGANFLFNTERCHLSSGIYDHPQLICKENADQRSDLHEEFRFMGAAFIMSKVEGIKFASKKDLLESPDLDFRGLMMELPAYWIDGIVGLSERLSSPSGPTIRDTPHWTADLEKGEVK